MTDPHARATALDDERAERMRRTLPPEPTSNAPVWILLVLCTALVALLTIGIVVGIVTTRG